MKIFRFESSLQFSNQDYFIEKLYTKVAVDPIKLKSLREKTEKLRQNEESRIRKTMKRKGLSQGVLDNYGDRDGDKDYNVSNNPTFVNLNLYMTFALHQTQQIAYSSFS